MVSLFVGLFFYAYFFQGHLPSVWKWPVKIYSLVGPSNDFSVMLFIVLYKTTRFGGGGKCDHSFGRCLLIFFQFRTFLLCEAKYFAGSDLPLFMSTSHSHMETQSLFFCWLRPALQ